VSSRVMQHPTLCGGGLEGRYCEQACAAIGAEPVDFGCPSSLTKKEAHYWKAAVRIISGGIAFNGACCYRHYFTRTRSKHAECCNFAELVDFCSFLSPTEGEARIRKTALKTISEAVTSIWTEATVEPFGSFVTGTGC